MSVSKIAILIERYKRGASVDECKTFFHPAQEELKVLQFAQQSVHLTALRRGLALSLLFNVILLAVLLVSIGGR